MSPDQINRAIQEIAGDDRWHMLKHGYFYRPQAGGYTGNEFEAGVWTLEEAKKMECSKGYPDEVKAVRARPRDFYNDLNAIHAVVTSLPVGKWSQYANCLDEICLRDAMKDDDNPGNPHDFAATAAQHSEAFLRIHGKWEETQ